MVVFEDAEGEPDLFQVVCAAEFLDLALGLFNHAFKRMASKATVVKKTITSIFVIAAFILLGRTGFMRG